MLNEIVSTFGMKMSKKLEVTAAAEMRTTVESSETFGLLFLSNEDTSIKSTIISNPTRMI